MSGEIFEVEMDLSHLVPERVKSESGDLAYDSDEAPEWEEDGASPEESAAQAEKKKAKESARIAQATKFNKVGRRGSNVNFEEAKGLTSSAGEGLFTTKAARPGSRPRAKGKVEGRRNSFLGRLNEPRRRSLAGSPSSAGGSTTGSLSMPQEVFTTESEKIEKTGMLLTRMGPNPRMKKWRARFYVLSSGGEAGARLCAYEDEKGEKLMQVALDSILLYSTERFDTFCLGKASQGGHG